MNSCECTNVRCFSGVVVDASNVRRWLPEQCLMLEVKRPDLKCPTRIDRFQNKIERSEAKDGDAIKAEEAPPQDR
jgi:hypothetical protein